MSNIKRHQVRLFETDRLDTQRRRYSGVGVLEKNAQVGHHLGKTGQYPEKQDGCSSLSIVL